MKRGRVVRMKRRTDVGHLEPVKFVATSLFLPFA